MLLQKIQQDTDVWVKNFASDYWSPHEILARLAEETGEVAREVNHLFGPKKKKAGEVVNNLGAELADVIFTIVCLANSQKIDLSAEWEKMMSEKHYGRDKNRFK